MASDVATGGLRVTGAATTTGAADLWIPNRDRGAPAVTGTNVSGVVVHPRDGGWRIEARVTGSYAIDVVPGRPAAPAATSREVLPATGGAPRLGWWALALATGLVARRSLRRRPVTNSRHHGYS
jgi:hypothetical protein